MLLLDWDLEQLRRNRRRTRDPGRRLAVSPPGHAQPRTTLIHPPPPETRTLEKASSLVAGSGRQRGRPGLEGALVAQVSYDLDKRACGG